MGWGLVLVALTSGRVRYHDRKQDLCDEDFRVRPRSNVLCHFDDDEAGASCHGFLLIRLQGVLRREVSSYEARGRRRVMVRLFFEDRVVACHAVRRCLHVLGFVFVRWDLSLVVICVERQRRVFFHIILCSEERRVYRFANHTRRRFALAVLGVFLGMRDGNFKHARVFRYFKRDGARFYARVRRVISDIPQYGGRDNVVGGESFLLSRLFYQRTLGFSRQTRVGFRAMLLDGVVM